MYAPRVVVRCTYGRPIQKAVAAGTGRAGERVDVWTLRAMTIAVEAFARRCAG